MKHYVIFITLLLTLVGCSSFKPTIVRYNDMFSAPINRNLPFIPQWEIRYNLLNFNHFYYRPYFANNWYLNNHWRFIHFNYTPQVFIPNRIIRPRAVQGTINTPPRIRITNPRPRNNPPRRQLHAPRRQNNNTRVTAPRRDTRSNQNVTPRRPNPNSPRPNVQPTRQNPPVIRNNRTNNGRRNQNQ